MAVQAPGTADDVEGVALHVVQDAPVDRAGDADARPHGRREGPRDVARLGEERPGARDVPGRVLPGAARGLALAATLAGTLESSPRREIRDNGGTTADWAADWAADPARVGHEPGYTWNEPDGIMRCVHCGHGPCTSPSGHRLSSHEAA